MVGPITFVRGLRRPEAFHGSGVTSGFFEGWYVKVVSADQQQRWAVIPGIFRGSTPAARTSATRHSSRSSTAPLDGPGTTSIPWSDFAASAGPLRRDDRRQPLRSLRSDAGPATVERPDRLHLGPGAVARHLAIARDHGVVRTGSLHGVLSRRGLIRTRAAWLGSGRGRGDGLRRRSRLSREGLGQGVSRGVRVAAQQPRRHCPGRKPDRVRGADPVAARLLPWVHRRPATRRSPLPMGDLQPFARGTAQHRRLPREMDPFRP